MVNDGWSLSRGLQRRRRGQRKRLRRCQRERHRHRRRPRHPGMRRPANRRRPASKSAIARTTTGCVSLVEATPRGNGGEPGLGCGGPGEARSTDGTCGRATTPGGPEHSARALLQSTLGRTPTRFWGQRWSASALEEGSSTALLQSTQTDLFHASTTRSTAAACARKRCCRATLSTLVAGPPRN